MKIKNFNTIIGLEVHVELKTKSKMFCGCSADYFGQKPNTHTCPVCLGLPGALPVPNKKAIQWCIMIGLALNCKIPLLSKFDRKNYFYPDLPKGYQISQYDQPFAVNGWIKVKSLRHLEGETRRHLPGERTGEQKRIRIRRVHMEEDTAKLIHQFGIQNSSLKTQNGEGYSLIDFNRSGVPLVEIVTEPDFGNAKEVVEYLKKLQQIIRYLNVSDADMEKGNMRLEPNISLMKRNTTKYLPNYKVEVKNINSFRFVEKAIAHEISRQIEIFDLGKTPVQETRGWNESKNATISQRLKEEANDYRYFPEPDIPPIRFTQSQILHLADRMPELPNVRFRRFLKNFDLSEYDAEILTRDKEISDYFEEAIRVSAKISNIKYQISSKNIANYIINKKVDINKTLPAELVQIIINDAQKSSLDKNKLTEVIIRVLSQNQKAVNDYKSGKVQVIGFLLGKVKHHFPKSDTNQIKTALEKYLKN